MGQVMPELELGRSRQDGSRAHGRIVRGRALSGCAEDGGIRGRLAHLGPPLHDRAMWRLRLPLAVRRQAYGRLEAIAWPLVMTAAVILLICIALWAKTAPTP